MECNQDFKKGDIIRGEKDKRHQARHFVIYLEGSARAPIGAVFTHSGNYSCNKLMQSEYFEESKKWFDEKQESYLIAHKFQKLEGWGPYCKVGKLTDIGLRFVEELVGNFDSEPYSEYERRTNRGKSCQLHRS